MFIFLNIVHNATYMLRRRVSMNSNTATASRREFFAYPEHRAPNESICRRFVIYITGVCLVVFLLFETKYFCTASPASILRKPSDHAAAENNISESIAAASPSTAPPRFQITESQHLHENATTKVTETKLPSRSRTPLKSRPANLKKKLIRYEKKTKSLVIKKKV